MKSDKQLGKLSKRINITLILVLIVTVITAVTCIIILANEKQRKNALSAQTDAAMQQGKGSVETSADTTDTTTDSANSDHTPEPDEAAVLDSGAENSSGSEPASGSAVAGSGAATASSNSTTNTNADTNIIFTGDVMLSPYVQKNYDKGGIDSVVEPALKEKLVNADILEINEEFPFGTKGTPESDKQYTFRVDPKYVPVFTDMGVDVVGLANNHILDYGQDCMQQTLAELAAVSIPETGVAENLDSAKQPVVIEKNGKKYAFIAASRVLPKGSWDLRNRNWTVFGAYDTTAVIDAIQSAKSQYDYVFVMIHWGTEKTTTLTNYQQKMGHSFIDAGADAVIGSHPHVLQGIEYYNGKPIFYSLGNFIFNQTINETAALSLTVSPDGTTTYSLIPAKAVNGTTQLESVTEAAKTIEGMRKISPGVNIDDSGVVTAGE
jgi:poly-gamma-glutamate synthesis protein (capsule biosynthesis protein)